MVILSPFILICLLAVDGQLKMVTIGQVQVRGGNERDFAYITGEDNHSTWHGDPPWDGSPEVRVKTPLLPLMVVAYALASSGILFALVCLLFNIIFRKRRLVLQWLVNLCNCDRCSLCVFCCCF